MQPAKKTKEKLDLKKDPEYQKLVGEILRLMDEARAKGILLFERDDLFKCKNCGTYEDVLFDGSRKTFLKSGKEAAQGFIVLDKKERSRPLGGKDHFTIRYKIICGVCGAHQTQTFKESFDVL